MLISLQTIQPNVWLGLYTIGGGRAEERRGTAELLKCMLGKAVDIQHNEDGKPFIENHHISISHCKGYVAILLSDHHEVGIDIELRSDRVLKIASRFLREDESYDKTDDILEAWCAKEAIYKLQSASHLGYQEMKVDVKKKQVLDLKNAQTIPYQTIFSEDYCMIIAVQPSNENI